MSFSIGDIDLSNIGNWSAGEWAENLLKTGLTVYTLAQAGGVDVPSNEEFFRQVTELYNDPQFREQAASAAGWQSEQQDRLQLESNRRMLRAGLEDVMGSDWDPNKSTARNIIDADKMYNPELYGAKDAIMGMQYGELGRVGTYFGDSIQNTNAAGQKMERMALDMLGNDQLNSRQIRDVNELARAGFNDRGRVRDTSAVIREVMDNEAARRARRDEARAFAVDSANINNPLAMDNAGRTDRMTQFNASQATNADLNNIQLDEADFKNQLGLSTLQFNTAQSTRVDPLSNAGVYTQNPNAQGGLLSVGDVGTGTSNLVGSKILADDEGRGRTVNALWGLTGPQDRRYPTYGG